MERNHNDQIVVLAREEYEKLLSVTSRTHGTTVSRITRHVRKFNPYLQPQHQTSVREYEKTRSEHIRLARKVVSLHQGKLVYVGTKLYFNQSDVMEVLTPLYLHSVDPENRHLVRLVEEKDKRVHRATVSKVSPNMILTELPEGYVLGAPYHISRYVREGSRYDPAVIEGKRPIENR